MSELNKEEISEELKNKIPELTIKKNFLGKWADIFIEKKRVTFLLILALAFIGIISYNKLPQEVNPEVTIPIAIVQTIYPGASPEEVESLVTDKIENKVIQVEGVKKVASTSGLGYSMVTVEFENADESEANLQKIKDKVSEAESSLPDEAEAPVVSDIKTSDTPIMIANLYGDYNSEQLKKMAEDIKEEIEKMKSISDVNIVGGVEREIKINVNPQKLAQYNLSLNQISSVISRANVNFPGGNVTLDNKNYNIRTVGEFEDIEDIKNTPISLINGRALLVKDVADVIDGYTKAEAISRLYSIDDENDTGEFNVKDSISLSIIKKESGSIIDISRDIQEMFKREKGILYPEDLSVSISGDMAKIVDEKLGNVMSNAASGLFLVIIVLFLFIGMKESLIVSFIIPTSIFVAFAFMEANGLALNTISLFSLILAVGLMVDNGIIVMENIHRLKKNGLSAVNAASVATNQIAPAVGAATLTTIAAFYPITLTPGILGDFIRQIPQTVIFALIASFFVAITITPTLSAIFLKDKLKKKITPNRDFIKKVLSVVIVFLLAMLAFKGDGDFLNSFGLLSYSMGIVFGAMMFFKKFKKKTSGDGKLIKGYQSQLFKIIKSPSKKLLVVVSMVLLLVASMSLVVGGVLKVVMFPSNDMTRLYVNVELPKGSILSDTEKITSDVEEVLFKNKEILNFVSNIGSSGADNFGQGASGGGGGTPNVARIIIELTEAKDRDVGSPEIAEEIRIAIMGITGGKIEVEEVASGPPSTDPVTIKIKGNNLDDIKNTAEYFAKTLSEVSGARDVKTGVERGLPEIRVSVKKEKARAFGLSDFEVAIAVRNAVNGLKTTVFRQDQEEIDVVIRTSNKSLDSVEDIKRLYFFTAQGQRVPFQEVAEINKSESLNAIKHEDGKRTVSVSSFIEDGEVASEVVERFKLKIEGYVPPTGITVSFGGEAEDIEESFTSMLLNMIIAIILVFLILAIQFNSLSQPIIILVTVPLALIGVINGLIITGCNFDFIAFVGFVGLIGIAVNDAIVFIDYINYLKKEGYDTDDAIRETGSVRFIPVIATTITTAGGILPITLKDEFLASMGYTLIFGLIVTSFLTLVIIPVMYSSVDNFKEKFKSRTLKTS